MKLVASDGLKQRLECWVIKRRYVDRVAQLRSEGRTYQTPRGTMLRNPSSVERASLVAMANDVLRCRAEHRGAASIGMGDDEEGTFLGGIYDSDAEVRRLRALLNGPVGAPMELPNLAGMSLGAER